MATTVVSEPTAKALSAPEPTLTDEIKLRDMGAEFWISRQVIRELLAVATKPGNLKEPNPVDRWINTARELEEVLYVATDDQQVTRTLLELIERPGALGTSSFPSPTKWNSA
jgi:hypothetical protein